MHMSSYLSVVIWYKHFQTPPTSFARLKMFVRNIKELSAETGLDIEIVVSQLPPYELEPNPEITLRNFPLKEHLTGWALNQAIRASSGEFILSTNRDIIFNRNLIYWLAKRKLRKDKVYRIDRTDIEAPDPYPSTPVQLRMWCEAPEKTIVTHKRQRRYLVPLVYPFPVPHSNGCGDFLLMHRDAWFRIRGFPELRGPSFHIDSMALYNAIFSKMKQEILKPPLMMYHIDHPRPVVIPIPGLMPIMKTMLTDHKPVILNGENWGIFD